MYYVNLKNGNVGIGTEGMVSFDSYATIQDLQTQTKRNNKTVESMLEEAELLTWIKLNSGYIVRGSIYDRRFKDYATEAEVKAAGGNLKDAYLKPSAKPPKETK
jgi:hypothetical protein